MREHCVDGWIVHGGEPAHLNARTIAADLKENVPGVANVTHIHAWSITEERPMITLKPGIGPDADADVARRQVKARLEEVFGVSLATVEIYVTGSTP